jgi:preprotein translocase subunit YajC
MTLDLTPAPLISLLAQAAPTAPSAPGILQFAPFLIILVMFYFLLIRPQQKRAKEHQALVDALKSGDKILTAGGIYGVVTNVRDKDKVITVRIAENVKIELEKSSVTTVIRDAEAAKS